MNTITEKKALRLVLVAAGLALAAGCASTPSPHLREARQEYNEARNGYANQYAPDDVLRAKVALDAAERAHERDAGSEKEKHLAYIAHRKAMIAKSSAAAKMAEAEREKAMTARERILLSQRDETRDSLASTKERLTVEKQARSSAQRTADAALERLGDLASVRTEDEKVVISLTGQVLFRFDEAELLPIAKHRLDAVAEVLKEQADGNPIMIEGHADSRGSTAYNEDLSQRRAKAVRDYLVEQGVPQDMVETVGKGEQEPIASNATAEGRANNRRVEIVIDEGATRTSRR